MNLDNPETESSLSIDEASTAFEALFEPPEAEAEAEAPKVDTEVDPPNADEEAAESAESEAEEEQESEDGALTIEVDGKQITLTKEQVAEAYKNGLRQSDYTQKTMAVAEQRKAAEAEIQKTQQERVQYAQNLQKMHAALETALEHQASTDWNALRESDPAEFLKQWHLQSQRQAALQENQRQQAVLAQQFQAEQAKAIESHLSTQQQELLAKLPEWKDEARAKSEREALKSYLKEQGYEDSAIANITDHKAVILGRKAMLYDQMMAKAQAAAKKVANAPTKVQRPGVQSERTPLDGRTAAMRQLSKTGSIEDGARAFESIL